MNVEKSNYLKKLQQFGKGQEKKLNFPKLDKRYKIQEIIGKGRFGQVAKAIDTKQNNQKDIVAVKKINIENEEQAVFALREAIILTEYSRFPKCHPNIVCIYQHEIHDNHMYIVTEYIKGKTIADLTSSTHMMFRTTDKEYTDFFWLCVQLFDALSKLHEKGIVHRDLHPENIMMTQDRYAIKIIDFGLACDITSKDPIIRCPIKGKRQLYFTPPEILFHIWERENIDVHIYKGGDVWAAGLSLHYAVHRRYPFTFPEENTAEKKLTGMMSAIKSDFEIEEALFDDITFLLEKLLEKNPKKRWTSEKARSYCVDKWKESLGIHEKINEDDIEPMDSLWTSITQEELDDANMGYVMYNGDN